jgi:hypothetical protein
LLAFLVDGCVRRGFHRFTFFFGDECEFETGKSAQSELQFSDGSRKYRAEVLLLIPKYERRTASFSSKTINKIRVALRHGWFFQFFNVKQPSVLEWSRISHESQKAH